MAIIYTYFAINIFIAGYWFNENLRWENKKYAFIVLFLSLLFGVLGCLIYCVLTLFSPILGWIYKEFKFQHRFRFTDYWDKIFLDDNYSEYYPTKELKLEKMQKLMSGFSKQTDRHRELVYNKYK